VGLTEGMAAMASDRSGTPALLMVCGTGQWDSAWRMMCPVVSNKLAQAEEAATDRWARLYFIISKLFNLPSI
jgi:hypothetical protein